MIFMRDCLFVGVLSVLAGGCEKPPPAPDKPKEITTKTGIVMVRLPAGEFVMGSDDGEDDEQPTRRVKIGAMLMDKFEVTRGAYKALMGSAPPAKVQADDLPVQAVTWRQASEYCNARSEQEGLTPCYDLATQKCDFAADGYRLPTEAEWEYACRAATTDEYSFGPDPRTLADHAWYKANARAAVHPRGKLKPNPWGLCDMQGNVSEWCNDFYDETYYARGETDNPRGAPSGEYRVLRGGNWTSGPDTCRSSARHFEAPAFADVCFRRDAVGFRCVRRAP